MITEHGKNNSASAASGTDETGLSGCNGRERPGSHRERLSFSRARVFPESGSHPMTEHDRLICGNSRTTPGQDAVHSREPGADAASRSIWRSETALTKFSSLSSKRMPIARSRIRKVDGEPGCFSLDLWFHSRGFLPFLARVFLVVVVRQMREMPCAPESRKNKEDRYARDDRAPFRRNAQRWKMSRRVSARLKNFRSTSASVDVQAAVIREGIPEV
jgi:hypothetical protein